MNKALALFLACSLFTPLFLFGFNPDKRVEKYFKRAENYLRKSDYLRAIPNLRECTNLKPEEAKYAFMLGKCYVLTNRKAESLPYFSSANRHNPTVDASLNYYLAMAYHANHRFADAKKHAEMFIAESEAEAKHLPDAMALLSQIQFAQKMVAEEQDYKIENLGEFVNTRYPEYAASFSDNYSWMTFTSRRPRDLRKLLFGLNHTDDIDEEIYHSSHFDGIWAMTKLFRKPVSKFRNDASVFVSEDGNTILYFIDKNNGDIFIVERDGNTWTKPESLGSSINSPYREPSVYLSSDGQSLFFSSDRPGGQGGLDLYFSVRNENGKWDPAENMGANLNSGMDEDAPFLSPDGKTLYFSSRGHSSMGGFDILKTTKIGDTWGPPENMGYPINSVGDDIYFVNRSDNKGFFFSSDRMGGFGDMDIYNGFAYTPDPIITALIGQLFDSLNNKAMVGKVRLIDPETGLVVAETQTDAQGNYSLDVPGGKNNKYKMDIRLAGEKPKPAAKALFGKEHLVFGTIVDGITGLPLKGSLELLDPETGQVLDNAISNPKTGRYFLPIQSGKNYQLRVKSPDYISYFEELKVSATGTLETHNYEINLQPVNDANKIVLNWQFFDYGKWEINNLYSDDLENLIVVLTKIPSLHIKIIGHTDWDGSQSYNQKLSERRAQAVGNFLINKGIDPSRLEAEGKGEIQPLYDNNSEKLKPWNRRVELFLFQ